MNEADALRRQALEEAATLVANMARRLAELEVAYETMVSEHTTMQQEVAALRVEREQLRASLRFLEEQQTAAGMPARRRRSSGRRWWRFWRSS
jgi:hypothetical protein